MPRIRQPHRAVQISGSAYREVLVSVSVALRSQSFQMSAADLSAQLAALRGRAGARRCLSPRMPPPPRPCARSVAHHMSPGQQSTRSCCPHASSTLYEEPCTGNDVLCASYLQNMAHTTSVTPSWIRAGSRASNLRSLLPPRTGCNRSSWMICRAEPPVQGPNTVLSCRATSAHELQASSAILCADPSSQHFHVRAQM